MKYDRVKPSRPFGYMTSQWPGIKTASVSCAFLQQYGDMSYNQPRFRGRFGKTIAEDKMWEALCCILTVSRNRSVIFTTTDKTEKWKALIQACPYITLVDEVPTQHKGVEPYMVQFWIAKSRKRSNK